MTTFLTLKKSRISSVLICLALLSACATQSKSPSTAGNVNFGEKPTNYKQIVKTYFEQKKNGVAFDLDKVDFLNEPNKYIYEQFTQEKFGYRVCALIPNEDMEDLRSHFFLIKDGKIIKHAYDSGMISLSNKFCNIVMLSSERVANNKAAAVAAPVDANGFKYISCQSKKNETLFAFSPEKKQLLQQSQGKQTAQFDIQELSETFIVATNKDSRISINRISGTMLYKSKGVESKSHCELTSQQRF